MESRFLLDTNSVIYYTNDDLPQKTSDFLDKEIPKGIYLSVISEIELLGFNAASKQEALVIESFVVGSSVIPLIRPIILKTIDIRKAYKIKLPDAIIAATALVYDFTLISRNDEDFRKITGLKYINPFTDL